MLPPIDQLKVSPLGGEVRAVGQTGNQYRFRLSPAKWTGGGAAPIQVTVEGDAASKIEIPLELGFPKQWLGKHPLTHADLIQEQEFLAARGFDLVLKSGVERER